jgi:hypothetical protein
VSCSITTLAALAQCFVSGMYVDAGVTWMDRGVEPSIGIIREEYRRQAPGIIETGWTDYTVQTNEPRNQYARVAIGFEIELSARCSGYAEAWHISSIATGRDRGVNAAALGARCHVFGARR